MKKDIELYPSELNITEQNSNDGYICYHYEIEIILPIARSKNTENIDKWISDSHQLRVRKDTRNISCFLYYTNKIETVYLKDALLLQYIVKEDITKCYVSVNDIEIKLSIEK